MEIIILWMLVSALIALAGKNRKIGYFRTFALSLLLSPIIGLIIALFSEKDTDSLIKLKFMLDSGVIEKDEYDKEYRKIIPTREDKRNERIGYLIAILIILVIYLILR